MSRAFDIESIIQEATINEKILLLAGKDFWHTSPLERFNIPSIRTSDGPNGVRGTKFFGGVPAACLPCGTGLASTWDLELLRKAGVLIGEECLAKGAACWLGPTINIQRSPLGGRGFESFSEDPYFSGKLAGSYINGVQSKDVVATVKHYVANDQEHERVAVDAKVTERALREIYLLPFQIAIADSAPGAVMTAYNKVNGTHVSEDKRLLQDILRNEWRWKGLVMSDWFGTYSTTEAFNAGLDLEMPGPSRWRTGIANLAVSSRKVTDETINDRVRNVLEFVQRASKAKISLTETVRDFPEDRKLNRQLAGDSVVVLKNNAGVLPLSKDIKQIALIGSNLKNVAFCGGGSASLEPYYAISPYQGIIDKLGKDTAVHYEIGAYSHALLPILSDGLTTPDGRPGALISFFADPPSVCNRQVVDQLSIREAFFQLMDYRHPQLETLYYATVEGFFLAPATGIFQFGITVYGSGNLFIDNKLVIENTETQRPGTSFFGKGTAEEIGEVDLVEGKTYHVRLEFASSPTSKVLKPGVVAFPGGAGRIGAALKINEEEHIRRAVRLASENEHTIICVGLSKDWESEGFDRQDMDLPGNVSRLVSAVVEANPRTVVVTQSGTPINMLPWADKTTTQVHAWYGGNETGNGLADVLFGDVNANGRLPLSFPRRNADNPAFLNFRSEGGRVVYGEDIYVGYRYYEKVERAVLFPFGHGLSYTTFEFSDLNVEKTRVVLKVTNTGGRAGREVIQLYIGADEHASRISRPKKELKGFAKVFLKMSETQEVIIQLDRFATAYYDEILAKWVNEKGKYKVLIGKSSANIVLEGDLEVEETVVWSGL
ncbi:hypothetical protein V501_03399 [Pseudogymnoascus sp. VKM F-4519 (FW-2642)]|nr:hypothetical protein V501_03399 [Pseudogymnoascus sp. VKM F-4519 (FW-2642)]